jgi:hypothetical protein
MSKYITPSTNAITLDDQITAWAEKTFPRANGDILPIIEHLDREYRELRIALREHLLFKYREKDSANPELERQALLNDLFEEAADVRFILTHLVGRLSGNLAKETISKFTINQSRVWGIPDEFGVVEHIKEDK